MGSMRWPWIAAAAAVAAWTFSLARRPTIVSGHAARSHPASSHGRCGAARELVAAFGETHAFGAPDTLGRLLRTFSTSGRKAINFEQPTVLALAGHHLTPDARNVLVDTLAYSLLG